MTHTPASQTQLLKTYILLLWTSFGKLLHFSKWYHQPFNCAIYLSHPFYFIKSYSFYLQDISWICLLLNIPRAANPSQCIIPFCLDNCRSVNQASICSCILSTHAIYREHVSCWVFLMYKFYLYSPPENILEAFCFLEGCCSRSFACSTRALHDLFPSVFLACLLPLSPLFTGPVIQAMLFSEDTTLPHASESLYIQSHLLWTFSTPYCHLHLPLRMWQKTQLNKIQLSFLKSSWFNKRLVLCSA